MNLSYPFIRRPVGTTLLAIGLFLVGAVAYMFLPVSSLPTVDLNQYNLRKLDHAVNEDIRILQGLYDRTEPLMARDAKLEQLQAQLAGPLKDKKVLVFTCYKDTARYLHGMLTGEAAAEWRGSVGSPVIRRIDSGNHPAEREGILAAFAPVGSGQVTPSGEEIDVLISTDVLSEG